MRYMMSMCVLTVAASLAWMSQADESKSNAGSPPIETLLPGNCFVAATFDGSDAHMPALKETAAWKALEETELTARLLDIAQMFISATGEDNGTLAREAIEHVRSMGLSVAGSLSNSGSGLSPYGVVVLHDAGKFLKQISPMIAQATARAGEQVTSKTIDGRRISLIETNVPDVEVSWWNESGHLVISFGMRASEQVMSTIAGKSENISKNPKWSQMRKSGGYVVDSFGWMDIGRLLDQFGEMPLPPTSTGEVMSIRDVATLFGVHNFRELTVQAGFKGAQTWSDFRLVTDGPLTGLAALLQQKPLALAELPPMPKGTTGFGAMKFDLAGSYDTVLETIRAFLQKVEPKAEQDLDQALEQMEQVFGGDPRTELIAGLGDVWCIFADPASLPIPIGFSPVAAVSVKDKEILTGGISKVLDLIEQEAAGNPNFTIRRSTKDGREYYSFNASGMPIVPTIVVSDKWLVASLTPGSAQSMAQRESGKLPAWKPTDQVAAALKELPPKFSSITVTDPAPTYQQALLFAPMGLTLLEQQVLPEMAGGTLKMPFTAEDLPAVELVTEPMFPNVTVGFSAEDGIGSTTRQSVPSNPFGNVSAGVSVPILVALLLPAVQQAREAARRTQSKNNLKQLGLAMHNYHDVYNHLPAGTVENDDLEPEERLGWGYSILPFLEQVALYNELDPESGWETESNSKGREIAVPSFQNPSQPGPRKNPSSSDYVAMAGVGEDAASLPNNDPNAGMFGYDRQCRFRDVTDGLSNTIMITDASKPTVSFLAGGKETIRGFSQSPYLNGPDGIGSPHTGVVQMLLGDGSVRAVSINVDEKVLEAIATKSGGEIVPEF